MCHYPGKSTATYIGKAIDSRYLTLAFEFYGLSAEAIMQLTDESAKWLQGILGEDTLPTWRFNGQCITPKKLIHLAQKAMKDDCDIRFQFEAVMRSDKIHSLSAAQKWRATVSRLSLDTRWPIPGVAVDFESYWRSKFPVSEIKLEDVRDRILQVFNEPGRACQSLCFTPDIQGHFNASHYANDDSTYYGFFEMSISAFSLGESVDHFAQFLASHMIYLSETYHQLNARVMLQPLNVTVGKSPYMDYFGGNRNSDGSHEEIGQTPFEWYTTYYLCGVEWANIISPRAKIHMVKALHIASSNKDVLCAELSGGGVYLKSSKAITEYDVADAVALKQIAVDALYPGGSERSLKQLFAAAGSDYVTILPRYNWAIIPVLENELHIVGNKLVLRSTSFWKNM